MTYVRNSITYVRIKKKIVFFYLKKKEKKSMSPLGLRSIALLVLQIYSAVYKLSLYTCQGYFYHVSFEGIV